MDANIITFPDRATLMRAAADRIAETLRVALNARGSACAALSGGTTPEPVYRDLAQRNGLDWPKITFALVDERFVSPRDESSNERLLEETLAPAFAKGAHFKPMYFATGDVEQSAVSANVLYEGLHIDIALMGMGADGHTASWFAHAPGLADALSLNTARNVIAQHAPGAAGSPERLTLTRAALARAGRVLLLITGMDKRDKLNAALAGDGSPVAALFDARMPKPEVFWAP
jgi:6-phosphogluconolactonase